MLHSRCSFYTLLSHNDNGVAAHRWKQIVDGGETAAKIWCVSVHILYCCLIYLKTALLLLCTASTHLFKWKLNLGSPWKDGLFRTEPTLYNIFYNSVCDLCVLVLRPVKPPQKSPHHNRQQRPRQPILPRLEREENHRNLLPQPSPGSMFTIFLTQLTLSPHKLRPANHDPINVNRMLSLFAVSLGVWWDLLG